MVTRNYMLEKPSRPSSAVRFFHWNAVPPVINGLGALEEQLEHLSVAVRRSPGRALATALALGVALALIPRWKNR